MARDLDIDDVCAGHPLAQAELATLRSRAERAESERDWMRALLVRALAAFRHVGVVRGVDEWCEECEAALADAARKEGEG